MLYYQSLYASLDLSELMHITLYVRVHMLMLDMCAYVCLPIVFYVYMSIWGRTAMARSIFSEILIT